MRRAALAFALIFLAMGSIGAAETAGADDRVYARTAVPDETRKVGEVRLVERDGMTVVETALATRVIERVVAEIRQ